MHRAHSEMIFNCKIINASISQKKKISILNSITGTLKALNDKVDGLSAQVLSPMKEGARPRSPSVTSDKTVYSNGGRGYKRTKRGPFVPNAAKPAGGGK